MVAAGLVLLLPSTAHAHTEPDLVAVPAGSESTINLKPTHGCGGSPTIAVRIRAPLLGAQAGAVDGWTASSTPDAAGNTVLEWSGGTLPTDQEGAFPVTFVAPDEVGRLLTFPAVQVCESGEELAWIDGDPLGEYPAPRVLVLAPGSEPAETIDDVPLDAPGRDQLVAVIDVDNPQTPVTVAAPPPTTAAPVAPTTVAAPPTSAAAAATTATSAAGPTTTPATTAGANTTDPVAGGSDGSDGGSDSGAMPVLVVGAVAVVAAGAVTTVVLRRRAAQPAP